MSGRSSDARRVLVAFGILGAVVAVAVALWLALGTRPATLSVRPTPTDAEVRVGEHHAVGLTELSVPPGPVRVEVRAPGHLPATLDVHVTPGSTVELTPTLVPLPEAAP